MGLFKIDKTNLNRWCRKLGIRSLVKRGPKKLETPKKLKDLFTKERLARLNEREATIVKMRFGLDGNGVKTLEEVGRVFSVTRERIRQLEAKALRKMKHPVKDL